jgi:hypothetical protein
LVLKTYNNVPSNPGNLVQTHVPDDWDNDDDEEEMDSQRIWDAAYVILLLPVPLPPPLGRKLIGILVRNAKSPMPELVISRSSTSATVISPPPTAVIQAPMRILKRQTSAATPSNTFSTSPSPISQSLAEREAKYQEARERIFGSPKRTGQDGVKTPTPPPNPVPNAIHNPSGLETDKPGSDSNVSRAFGSKRGKRPPKP